MENKAEITKLLEATINATRMGKVKLTYDKTENGEEYVHIESDGNVYTTCVTADSGMSLIRDVINYRLFR